MLKRHTLDTPYPVGPVHIYTFELDSDIIMFDTGPYTPSAINYVKEKIDLNKLRYVFITHCHADHYGLENFIAKNSKAKIFLSYIDHLKFKKISTRVDVSRKLLKGYGFPETLINQIASMLYEFISSIPEPIDYEILEDGKFDIDIDYMPCPGHSKSDIVYMIDKYAITGDVLLDNIYQTPLFDVDFDKMDRFNNYKAYCETLKKIQKLKRHTILPGHRDHTSIEKIVTFYILKTVERASKIKDLIDLSVYKILKRILPHALNDPFTTYIKTSEILFFLDFLKNPHLLFETLKETGLLNNQLFQALAPFIS